MKLCQRLERKLHPVVPLSIVMAAMVVIASTPNSMAGEHWTDSHLQAGRYKLSLAEEQGVYSCSVRDGKVLDVEFARGYVTIIFADAAPRFFRQTELSRELLTKLINIQPSQTLTLLCVHSFYRDDWQVRYDEYGTVDHRLLDVISRLEN